jgi:hypothetical protein
LPVLCRVLQRILAVKYSIPPQLRISAECQDLLARIFVAAPAQRITLPEIKRHPWFLKNLPVELAVSCWAWRSFRQDLQDGLRFTCAMCFCSDYLKRPHASQSCKPLHSAHLTCHMEGFPAVMLTTAHVWPPLCVLQNPAMQPPMPGPQQSVEDIQRLTQLARTVGPMDTPAAGKGLDADGAIDEAMAEILDEEFEDEGFGASAGGAGGFVV